ncbi:hypothetical protein PVAP13_3NG150100 [Panicum virgatum]|uniref:GRF-type domain-containing protein n=1 Tax=Panicum virgatum TaxID=38727 RepID=A0A8T0U664_PANVG|nr:hypothetical protein PVAP13_3NG150100 [Panicum virgatum]
MNRGSSSNESSGMQMSRRRHKLPLITCTECGKHTVGEYEVKTDMKGNKGRIFFTCPARKRDGSGCPFWYWEEDYEKIVEKQKNKKDKHSESSPHLAIHDEDTARSGFMQVSHDIEQIVKSNFEKLNKTLQNLFKVFCFLLLCMPLYKPCICQPPFGSDLLS